VTLCTVTDAAMAYRAKCKGQELRFTPARLARNNLIMSDMQTGSSWQQFTGKGVDGPLAGADLDRLPIWRGRLEDWAKRHPQGVILKPLGNDHDCCAPNDTCPVMSYFPSKPFLLQSPTHEDDRLPRKKLVDGIISPGGDAVAIAAQEKDEIMDMEPALKVRCYWFAWVEFHPETRLASAWKELAVDRLEPENASGRRTK
jgi:hypothetical protein